MSFVIGSSSFHEDQLKIDTIPKPVGLRFAQFDRGRFGSALVRHLFGKIPTFVRYAVGYIPTAVLVG